MACQPAPSKSKKYARSRLTFAPNILQTSNAEEMIQTLDADPPLQQFPAILRRQIEEYLSKKTDDRSANFASTSTVFRLSQTYTGEFAYFVVPGSKEPLDAGLYQYGIRKGGRRIVVVQPKDGRNTFNHGEPAIIAYYSKGRKNETLSRHAVWSPDGVYRDDIFVDHMRGQQVTVPRLPHNILNLNEPSVQAGSTSALQRAQVVSHTGGTDPVSQPCSSQHNVDHFARVESNGNGCSSPTAMSSPSYYDGQNNKLIPSIEADQILKRALPLYLEDGESQHLHKKSFYETCNRDESMIRPDLAAYTVGMLRSSSNSGENVVVSFKENIHTKDVRLSKTLNQCDSVQKFFAYARMAKISDHKHAMLEAHINEADTVLIVRDDDSTFQQLLGAVKQKQIEEGQKVHINITLAEY